MIGCTKLLCGTATVSDVIKYNGCAGQMPPELLQFSNIHRPLVVWNTTNRCNLHCRHCYLNAEDRNYELELSTGEAISFIQDLAQMQVPVLLFSGGEPLMRRDIYELGALAAGMGLRPVLSTNGTLIDEKAARAIKNAGFQYVGVSIDGKPVTHNNFRNHPQAFELALRGLRICRDNGIKTGVRFTMNKINIKDLPEVFDIVEKEKIPRLCIYHLVYAGRGREMMQMDTEIQEKRDIFDYISWKTVDLHRRGVEVEVLTTDNHADGIYLYNRIKKEQPDRADEVVKLLTMHGGCSAGTKFANVDPQGNVHPCQFWQDYSVGNVREMPFSAIWNSDDSLMVKLRQKDEHLTGKCGECDFKSLCGGCRIRARAVYGDLWAKDPACYLTTEEIKRQGDKK